MQLNQSVTGIIFISGFLVYYPYPDRLRALSYSRAGKKLEKEFKLTCKLGCLLHEIFAP
jgi:hypothetical protein